MYFCSDRWFVDISVALNVVVVIVVSVMCFVVVLFITENASHTSCYRSIKSFLLTSIILIIWHRKKNTTKKHKINKSFKLKRIRRRWRIKDTISYLVGLNRLKFTDTLFRSCCLDLVFKQKNILLFVLFFISIWSFCIKFFVGELKIKW